MKQLVLFATLLTAFVTQAAGQTNYVSWNFNTSITSANYASNTTNQNSARSTDLTDATIPTISLSNVTAGTGNTYHRTTGWPTAASRDASEYIEFSVTLTNGYTFPNDSFTLRLTSQRSSSTSAPADYQVWYAWGANAQAIASNGTVTGVPTSGENDNTATIPAPGNTTETVITIRIHAYNSTTATGNIRFGVIQLQSASAPLAAVTATVTISSPAQVSTGNVEPNTNNHVLSAFQIAASESNRQLQSIAAPLSGTYQSADIKTGGFKLWTDTDADFAGATQLGTSQSATSSGSGETVTFSGFGQFFDIGTTSYYWITADIDASATSGRTIRADAISSSGFTIATISGGGGGGGDDIPTLKINPAFIKNSDVTGSVTAGGLQTIFLASAPAIEVTGTLTSFGNIAATFSSALQTFTVSGSNLTANATVTAPSGFEVSLESDGLYGSSVDLTQSGGTLTGQPVTVYVQFAPESASGAMGGNITVASTGAATQNVAVSGFAFASEPLTQASAVTFGTTTATSMVINWTRGSGDSVIVAMRAGSAVADFPADRTAYTASSVFGSGSNLGNSTRVVFEGTGTTVTVTGLSGSTTYHVAVMEYNSGALSGVTNYNVTSPATGSQITTTPPPPPVVINKYANGSPDIIELLVYQDGYDMRGMLIKDFSSSMGGDNGRKYTFTSNALWSSVKAGTLIVLRNNSSAADVDGSDLSIDLGLQNTTYLTATITGTFDIATTDMIMLKYAGSDTAGVTGSMHVLAGGTAGSNYTAAPEPKVIGSGTTGSGFAVFVNNTTSSIADYNGTGATGATAVASLTFGQPNNVTNEIFRNSIKTYHAAIVTGTSGWRMMSAPNASSFSTLLSSIWSQGFTGASTASGDPSVLQYNGSAFAAPSNASNALTAGTGFIVNVYEDNDGATAGVQGAFPKTISVTGTENAAPVNVSGNSGSGVYTLAGNPFASSIDWDVVFAASTEVAATAYVYDPTYSATADDGGSGANVSVGGAYRAWNGTVGGLTNGLIAPFQGFWVQSTGNSPSISFTTGAKTTGATFRGKTSDAQKIRMIVSGEKGSNDAYVHFSEKGQVGFDAWDGWKLYPFTNDYMLLNSGYANGFALDINHLPLISERMEIPFSMETTLSGTFSLKLEAALPADVTLEVFDTETGVKTTLGGDRSYTFAVTKASKAYARDPKNGPEQVKAVSPRFVLIVTPGASTSNENRLLPTELSLSQNYPNPFNPTTAIQFALPVQSNVRLSVFDMNGRQVDVLAQGVKAAGTHTLNWNAAGRASGVYMLRLEAGGQVFTRKMTLLK